MLRRYFRDPFSGLVHLLGALLGVVGLIYLIHLAMTVGTRTHLIGFVIFGVTLILLYLSSAAYHLPHVNDKYEKLLRQIDHSMIFVFIAGTYTPFCLVPLKGVLGYSLLTIVWAIAIGGVFVKVFWIHAPRWLSTGLYLLMGWLVVLAIVPLSKALSHESLVWLIAGGLTYTVGAIVYLLKKPDPFPPDFGYHEIWHLCVLAASLFQFMSVVMLLT